MLGVFPISMFSVFGMGMWDGKVDVDWKANLDGEWGMGKLRLMGNGKADVGR